MPKKNCTLELFEIQAPTLYATVILPMATPKPYTYHVPEDLVQRIAFGIRVEVQFGQGRDLYAALVIDLSEKKPEHLTKPILQIIDNQPIITTRQLEFWRWLGKYYACTLGEIMTAALPTNLKLSSETRIVLNPNYTADFEQLDDKEYIVAEALTLQNELSVSQIQAILGQKTVYPILNRLLMYGVLELKEELQQKFKPKTATYVRILPEYAGEKLAAAFDLIKKSEKQLKVLLALVQIARTNTTAAATEQAIRAADIYEKAGVDISVLRALEKKGILSVFEQEVSRIGGYEDELTQATDLSAQQIKAVADIKTAFASKNVALLHGVTGSGKTRVFTELMQEVILRGGQVLYLLPEIALTTQIVNRLKTLFGDSIAVYHSRLSGNERVEMWNETLAGKPIVMGVRSALFLPFSNLELIIVDEEHDPSFKQNDPAPRYNARDAAIYLATLYNSKVLLGTATPSVESFWNTQHNKYALIEMPERFGGLQLPEVEIIDCKVATVRREMHGNFSKQLIEALKQRIEAGEQAILFQNRRGYAPTMMCPTCGWVSECKNCDVTLTYHKHANALNCHYCGYSIRLPTECPACASKSLIIKGFGTERIEDELKILLPDARISRLDLDTARSRSAHSKIIHDFEERHFDILVGTQMVTKGLDFENVGLVGVLSADNLLRFPDFRASERAFQLMMQVAGRAGRKHKRGKVLIQAYDIGHPVLADVKNGDFLNFYKREIVERQELSYPPFVRLIQISLKHKKVEVMNDAVKIFTKMLKQHLGARVHGPSTPQVPRVNTYFITDFLIKMERDPQKLAAAKQYIADSALSLQQMEGFSGVRLSIDIDPY